jgi:hypothetical protein
LLCLFIKVIEIFAKSFCFFVVLFINHHYQNLHRNRVLHSRSLTSRLSKKLLKVFFVFFFMFYLLGPQLSKNSLKKISFKVFGNLLRLSKASPNGAIHACYATTHSFFHLLLRILLTR